MERPQEMQLLTDICDCSVLAELDKHHWHSFSLPTLVRHLSIPGEQLHLAGSSQTKCLPRFTPIHIISVVPGPGEMCCFGIFNHHRDFSGLVMLKFGGREMRNLSVSWFFFSHCSYWFCLGEFRGKRTKLT